MIPDILDQLGGYLHTVFVANLDVLVIIGFLGQALLRRASWCNGSRANGPDARSCLSPGSSPSAAA